MLYRAYIQGKLDRGFLNTEEVIDTLPWFAENLKPDPLPKKLKELDPEAFDLDQINEAVTNQGASYLFVEWFRSRTEEERVKAYSSLSFKEFYSLLEFREEISLLKMLPHCSFTLEERHKIYLKTANADMVFALLSLKDDGVTRWLN